MEILVSVICLAYNHEDYIRKALDGFIKQKTNFNFEIVIHDDASKDSTASIIREYELRYPEIIRPIYQKENQYQKGNINIFKKFIYPQVRGKYIAYCEGDDYWIDENKLQIQADYMESDKECAMCCHGFNCINSETEETIYSILNKNQQGILSAREIISHVDFPQTATRMYRREVIINRPDFSFGGCGDYYLLVFSLLHGHTYYINKVMSNYRICSNGSWTNRIKSDGNLKIQNKYETIKFLKEFDSYSEYIYHDEIEDRIDEYEFSIYIDRREFFKALNSKYYKKASLIKKVKKIFNHIKYKVIFN